MIKRSKNFIRDLDIIKRYLSLEIIKEKLKGIISPFQILYLNGRGFLQ